MKLLTETLKLLFYKIRSNNNSNDVTATNSKVGGTVEQSCFISFLPARFTGEGSTECEMVTSLQAPYLNGRLEKRQLALVNLHLNECAACAEKKAYLEEFLSSLFFSLQPVDPDPQVRTAILEKIKSE